MPTILKFEDPEVWKKARQLSLSVFLLSQKESFLKEYKFKEQIKSAAGSVMDNIAEGFDRASRLEFVYFLGIARGSCGEVKSQLYRALDQEFIAESEFKELYDQYDGLNAGITAFINYLNKSGIKGLKFRYRHP